MLESSILFLAVATVLVSTVVAAIFILVKIDNYDGVYVYFDDKRWLEIPKILAQKYIIVFKSLFGPNLFGLRASINIILLSLILTVSIMILWRGISIGSFSLAVNQAINGSFGVTILSWGLSSALVAPLSLIATSKLLYNSANSSNHRTVYRNTLIDSIITYLLISLSLYFCLLTTMSGIALYEGDIDKSIDMIKIFGSFAHTNAITWPTHSVTSVAGLSAIITSVTTLLPTIIFILIMLLSLFGLLFFKLISPLVVSQLNWVSNQNAAKLSTFTIISGAIIGLLTALIKMLEVMNT